MPDYAHRTVLRDEVLAALGSRSGGRYADGTLGGAGHAAALLRASGPDGWLFGCDRDPAALEAARVALAEFVGRFELRQGNFADLARWVPAGSLEGVVLDLGVSSPQLDQPGRGFSFQQDGPLDMRFDPTAPMTAARLVNEASADELARIFWELGDAPHSRRLARAIVELRAVRPLRTTRDLAALMERAAPRRGRATHPATRVFLALRMAVNEELGSLARGLPAAWTALKPGGRLAVITFHSGEDRLVKQFGRALAQDYEVTGDVDVPELRRPRVPEARWVTRRPTRPGAVELAVNPRARSAQLRVIEKL
ncbi:MAG: 16S rRNA (cytosine(1402)-N(4))-methyltransferase RsmH [Verrucomicrobiota bacterium]